MDAGIALKTAPRIHRTPTILQLEAVECGAAALAMILAHHGRWVPLEQMRVDCGVTRDGSKAGGLLRAARAHGLVARGFKKEPGDLAELPLPAIVFVNFNHFVVLEGIREGRVYLNDPARGRRRIDAAEFDQAFTGVVLTFEKSPAFEPGGRAPSVRASLARYLEGFRGSIALAFFLGLVLVVPGVVMPWLLGRFVDDVLVSHISEAAPALLVGLAAAAIARTGMLWLQSRLLLRTFGRAARGAAGRFLSHAMALPMGFYSQRSAGEIAARVDLNERVAETISSDLAGLALGFVTAAFFLGLMLRLNVALSVVVVAGLALQLAAWRVLSQRTAEVSQELSVQGGKLSGVALGGLSNIETIKAGGQEAALFGKWIGLQVQFVNSTLNSQRMMVTLGQIPMLVEVASGLAVLGVGALLIMRGSFSIGDLVAFNVLLAGFSAPVHHLFGATQKLQGLRGDLARLDDVLNHAVQPGIEVAAGRMPADAPPLPRLTGALEFRGVTFGYDRNAPPLIADLSLSVRPGGRVALVGASGSGKSTLARLAAGLYEPWSGEILFDGVPRASHEREHLARNVAYVDQDVVLFEGTVRDNLTLWDTVPDEAVRRALADAAIEQEVAGRAGGLDAPLEEGARNLSGGQRQRLEIARALARDPAVLILDEATSALDPVSEATVEANVRRRGITCLVVAHRLSTVRDADEIIVLDGGQVAERGTHESLAAIPGGRYAALVASEAA